MAWNALAKYSDHGLLVIRLVLGCMFFYYGWPKLAGGTQAWAAVGQAVEALGIRFGFTFWGFLAAMIMVLGGVCFVTGIFFRPACLFLFLVMFVAASMHFQKGDGLMGAAHAIDDGIVFLGLLFVGPGRFVLAHL
ncbi:MAG: DoxX family protein [Candidatus Omnitrophica bacterium]|nr:DoxX family protein [Candidatus Omnitrophota bacterium]MDD5575110.1 DoxX family protein [Candidatus Omnitrophota bacterium]